jgi:hypothetical protein
MNPGFSLMLGLSARHATSVPETTDWRKKFASSATSDANLSCDRFGGRRRRLVQLAPATAASPTGRSAKPHPEIMSQKARKSVARTATARGRSTETLPDGGLNAPIQSVRRAVARPSAPKPACERSHDADRSSGSAYETSIPSRYEGGQGYHVRSGWESIGTANERATARLARRAVCAATP